MRAIFAATGRCVISTGWNTNSIVAGGGEFLEPPDRRTARASRRSSMREAFAAKTDTHPWKTVKALILTGYYTSEAGGSQGAALRTGARALGSRPAARRRAPAPGRATGPRWSSDEWQPMTQSGIRRDRRRLGHHRGLGGQGADRGGAEGADDRARPQDRAPERTTRPRPRRRGRCRSAASAMPSATRATIRSRCSTGISPNSPQDHFVNDRENPYSTSARGPISPGSAAISSAADR